MLSYASRIRMLHTHSHDPITGGRPCRPGTPERSTSSRTSPQVLHSERGGPDDPDQPARRRGAAGPPGARAGWILVVDGEVEIEADGATTSGGPGLLALTAPNERHEVRAKTDARLVLCSLPGREPGTPPSARGRSRRRGHARPALRHPRQPPGARGGDRRRRRRGRGGVRARRRLRPCRGLPARSA